MTCAAMLVATRHMLLNMCAMLANPQVFHQGDTFTTKLKTAHDYKLTMRTQYQLTTATEGYEDPTLLSWPQLITLGK